MPHRSSLPFLILLTLVFSTLAGLLLGSPALASDGAQQAFVQTTDSDVEWGACPAFMPETCELAVVQGDPAERNADIFFKVPGGTELPRHWHHSPERIVMLSGTMTVDYDGQDPVRVETGAYAYGPAELPHSAVCISEEECILFIAFEEPVDAMPK